MKCGVCVCEEECGVCVREEGGGGERRCVVSKNKNPTLRMLGTKLNGSYKLRAIKSVKLSANMASKRLKCVTITHFYTIRPKPETPNPRSRCGPL